MLCIAPHLSTGGLPQYLTKKVELIKDEFEIYLIEWDNLTGGVLVVQKNRLQEMIPSERFFVLGEDKTELFNIIDKIQPDIIHLEEIPEYFMDFEIAKKLYNQNDGYSPDKGLTRVASIPTIILEIWAKEYNGDQNKGNWFALPKDVQHKILREKLNSSDYRYFRTAPGKF